MSGNIWHTHELLLKEGAVLIDVDLNRSSRAGAFVQRPHLLIARSYDRSATNDMTSEWQTRQNRDGSVLHCSALYVGHCRLDEFDEWSFYVAEADEGLAELQGRGQFAPDSSEFFATESDNGSFYDSFLLPSDFRDLSIALVESLDDLPEYAITTDLPRSVRHWMYWPSNTNFDELRDSMSTRGFDVEDSFAIDDMTVCTRITKPSILGVRTLHFDLAQLYVLAGQHGGRYDGWEVDLTPVP